jgi:DNA polymerase I-like protein with 3'-5' exonuclease and polymerase domains
MNYIITKNRSYFEKIGKYKYCNLEDMILPDTIAIDTETTGLVARHCDFTCVQIGTGTHNYIIHMYDNNYTFDDLKAYLDDKELVFHNAQFDLGFMYKYNYFPKYVRDTMIASKIFYNGQFEVIGKNAEDEPIYSAIQHTFGHCMKRELGIVYDKTDQKNIHLVKLSQESTIKYSFNDVDRLLDLHKALSKKIDDGGFRETYDLHCQYTRVLAYMEQCGLPISAEKWEAKMIQDIEDAKKWEEIIKDYIYDNLPQFADRQIDMFDDKKRIHISINSPKQAVKVFNALGIPTKDKDGKDSINENIISKSKHEFVKMWLGYQKANHRVTTFGATIYNKIENGRIYTNFNPMVDTARLSCRKGSINFLNFPSDKATREAFVASPGNTIVVCDWSGQETVIAADMSGDEAMTKSVVEGADLHCLLARILFPELEELSDEEIITNHKSKRQDSKAPRFAINQKFVYLL